MIVDKVFLCLISSDICSICILLSRNLKVKYINCQFTLSIPFKVSSLRLDITQKVPMLLLCKIKCLRIKRDQI